jgi:hypothetical protein
MRESKAASRHVQRGHGAAVKVQDLVLRLFGDSALEPGEAEEDYVPVTPRHYLGREAVSKTRPCRVTLTKKTPPSSCFDCASEPRQNIGDKRAAFDFQ